MRNFFNPHVARSPERATWRFFLLHPPVPASCMVHCPLYAPTPLPRLAPRGSFTLAPTYICAGACVYITRLPVQCPTLIPVPPRPGPLLQILIIRDHTRSTSAQLALKTNNNRPSAAVDLFNFIMRLPTFTRVSTVELRAISSCP